MRKFNQIDAIDFDTEMNFQYWKTPIQKIVWSQYFSNYPRKHFGHYLISQINEEI